MGKLTKFQNPYIFYPFHCSFLSTFFFFFLTGENLYRKMNQIFCMVLDILPQLCLLHFVLDWLPAEENHLFWYVTPLCPAWLYNLTENFTAFGAQYSDMGKSEGFLTSNFEWKPPAAQKHHIKCKGYSCNFWKSFHWPQRALNATLSRGWLMRLDSMTEVGPLDSDNVFY